MKIIIGTRNQAKIKGCKKAIKKLELIYPLKIAPGRSGFYPVSIPSGVPDMPLTLNDIQNGARNRALSAYKSYSGKYAIGMEGGVYKLRESEVGFLQSWVYITDGQHGHFGCSAALELPQKITGILFDTNRELAGVIDEISGKTDVRSQNGAFGILTHDLYSREQAFEDAVINGFTPFLNDTYYGEEQHGN